MKIREGFVSNSSSSSFVIKTKMSKEDLEKELRRIVDAFNVMAKTEYSFESMFEKELGVIDGENVNAPEIHYVEETWSTRKNHLAVSRARERFLEHNFVLRSSGDNSVPYILSQILEACFVESMGGFGFSCYRIHRG